MILGKETLFFFSTLGAFNGLLISIYLWFVAAKRSLPHYFLGWLLFTVSIRIAKSVLVVFYHPLPKIYLQIGLSACYFIGPFLYFFIQSSKENIKVLPLSWKIHLLVLFLVIFIAGAIYPYSVYPDIWNKIYFPAIYFIWFIYIFISGFQLKNIFSSLYTKTNKLDDFEKWMISVFFIIVLLFSTYLWAYLGGIYISGAVSFSFITYLGIFFILNRQKKQDLFPLSANKHKPNKHIITDDKSMTYQLTKLMTEKLVYKNQNLKLHEVALMINVSSHELSQHMNENIGKSFNQYINEYRIEAACNILKSQTLLSVEGIGSEVGFSSKSSFFSTFKKIKGVTPTEYKKTI